MAKSKQSKAVSAVDILRHARALLARRGGWTKHNLGADRLGNQVLYETEPACKFCAWGAVLRAEYDVTGHEFGKLSSLSTELLENELGSEIVKWNDAQKSKKPVLALFDQAIARLEAQKS